MKRCCKRQNCVHPDGPFLDETQFGKHSRNPDGLKRQCRKCEAVARRNHRETRSEDYFERERKRHQKYRQEHPDRVKAADAKHNHHSEAKKRWVVQNRDKIREAQRRYVANNKSKVLESHRKYYESNKPKYKVNSIRRRALKRSLPMSFTFNDWSVAVSWFNGCCAYCGRLPSFNDKNSALTQDHFIPVRPNFELQGDN